PPLAPGTTKHGNVLELHEDDWRQVELVARSQGVEVCRCLGHIDRIYAEERTPGGAFRQLHVRTEVAEPLPDSRLRLEEVRAAFGARLTAFDGLGYRQAAG